MSGGIISRLTLALFLGLATATAIAAQVVDAASARRAITAPAAVAIDAELAALALDGRSGELAARLELIASDRTLDAVAQEWLLDNGLHHLATLAPTAPARMTVQRLARRAPIVFTRVDPDHGPRVVPLYDAGATARFVLKTWQRTAAREQAAAELRAGGAAAVTRFAALASGGDAESERAGIVDAYAAAPAAQLLGQRAAIVAAIAAGQRVDELGLVAARRLADAELLGLVLGHADAPVALTAVGAAREVFDPQTALQLLSVASQRADIASAAMLEIGQLARHDSAARGFAFDALEDPALGPSAAAALASVGDAGIAAELGRRLQASQTEPSRRLLVLALKLDGSDSAQAELRRFAAARKGSPQLQREVRQWLEH